MRLRSASSLGALEAHVWLPTKFVSTDLCALTRPCAMPSTPYYAAELGAMSCRDGGLVNLQMEQPAPQVQAKKTEELAVAEAPAAEYIQLNVNEQVQPALDRLLELVVRDFIMSWYTASISLGDGSFGIHARSTSMFKVRVR
jgi:hypothetical protein